MSAEQVKEAAEERDVRRLMHFTPAENLRSIMLNGLVSQRFAEDNDIIINPNDNVRFDGHLNALSLSITLPNYKMFYKCRQQDAEIDWVVLTINKSVLWNKNCAFYTTNAACAEMSDLDPDTLKSRQAFEAMFEDHESRAEELLQPRDTTDVQAEVLVFDNIEPELITGVYFHNENARQAYSADCNGVRPEVANLLFSERRYIRARVR